LGSGAGQPNHVPMVAEKPCPAVRIVIMAVTISSVLIFIFCLLKQELKELLNFVLLSRQPVQNQDDFTQYYA
jgi:hypothetical protein